MTTLQSEAKKGKNQTIRLEGKIPVSLHGGGKNLMLLQIKNRDFEKFYKNFGGSHTLTLATPEGDYEVLINDIQKHPVTGNILHITFNEVTKGKPVHIQVPIHFEGEVKISDGNVVKNMTEIEMQVLPKDIPEDFTIDISVLKKIGDSIKIANVQLPKSAIVSNLEDIIVHIVAQKEEVEDNRTVDDVEVNGEDKIEEEKSQ